MKRLPAIALTALVSAAAAGPAHAESDPAARALIEQVSHASGTYECLQGLVDVEYTYTYRDNRKGTTDVSTERYLFDGELSWAEYTTHESPLPVVSGGTEGTLVQGWDGDAAWVTVGGERVTDESAVARAFFQRKTNFYWFAMMQKLMDPGTIHKSKGQAEYNGTTYDLIELTFDVPEGVAADTYVLYVNPETKLVDLFLFTVVDFGVVDEPLLMEVAYETFGPDDAPVKLPVTRRYTASTWAGEVADDAVWVDEIMTDLSFGHGFTPADFTAPGS
ncbi:MAG: hypothetical protein AAF800_06620 [Planctomycetota bacterium]